MPNDHALGTRRATACRLLPCHSQPLRVRPRCSADRACGAPVSSHFRKARAGPSVMRFLLSRLASTAAAPRAPSIGRVLSLPRASPPRLAALQVRSQACSSIDGEAAAHPPTRQQLIQLGLVSAIPFVGFGFMDNFIMILAGDAIDATLGVSLGVSTMCAAGLGNTLSDCIGVWAGDWIEAMCRRAGLSEPKLTDEQKDTSEARVVKTGASVAGLTLGCLIGMFPLLFQQDRKPLYFKEGEEEIYDHIFRPHGVSMQGFFDLMKVAKLHKVEAGTVLATEGKPFDSVLLLCSGAATGKSQSRHKTRFYRGKLQNDEEQFNGSAEIGGAPRVRFRGCLIGGSKLVEDSWPDKKYTYDVCTTAPSRYIEWPREAIRELMSTDRDVETAMLSIFHADLLSYTRQNKRADRRVHDSNGYKEVDLNHEKHMEIYSLVLTVVTADNYIHPSERTLCNDFRARYGLSNEDHAAALKGVGWTLRDWNLSSRENKDDEGPSRTAMDLSSRISKLLHDDEKSP